MLTNLQISNVVLIERLNLEFGAGLNILTGETGAGKSILMDALALALGARGDAGLVRAGATVASVCATFDTVTQSIAAILDENGIENDGQLILRRQIAADGKGRAWINDTPVSVKTLRQVGDILVEIHGQFANHALLDAATHLHTLDEFARANITGFAAQLDECRASYDEYSAASKRLAQLNDMLARAAAERDFLAHNVEELRALNPQIGEEEDLSGRRAAIINAEKDAAILSDAAAALGANGNSLDGQLYNAAHILERIKAEPNPYTAAIDRLYNAAQLVSDAIATLTPPDDDMSDVDAIEERLFALRAVARKHRVACDELPALFGQMSAQLNAIDNSDAELKKLKSDVAHARERFDAIATRLTTLRADAAKIMRDKILAELPDLKLGNADFMVARADAAPSATGVDEITFMIRTNPGMPFAPLHKSASGGELARLMLALRVVMTADAQTFVFDEVDTGISGATSQAVGIRLKRLAARSQALVITHSAQVAGCADRHFKIEKSSDGQTTTTTVREIVGDARLDEIARIISGAEITPQALATARTLMHAE